MRGGGGATRTTIPRAQALHRQGLSRTNLATQIIDIGQVSPRAAGYETPPRIEEEVMANTSDRAAGSAAGIIVPLQLAEVISRTRFDIRRALRGKNREKLKTAAQICERCSAKAECEQWIAKHQKGDRSPVPSFCPNAPLIRSNRVALQRASRKRRGAHGERSTSCSRDGGGSAGSDGNADDGVSMGAGP